MKKMILFLTLLLLIPVAIFAQDHEPPTTWVEVVSNFNTWFATLAGVAAVTVFLAGFMNTLFKISKKIWKQVVAWVISILIVLAGNLFSIGFVADFPILTTIVYGFAAGLVANGLFDINAVQAILAFLNMKKVKP